MSSGWLACIDDKLGSIQSGVSVRPCDGWNTTRVSVSTTTAVLLDSVNALQTRASIEIYNPSAVAVRVGPSVARVDAGHYRTVPAGASIVLGLGPDDDIAGRTESGSADLELTELANPE